MSNFNKLWLGQTISLLGSAVTIFALPTLAVLDLHATPVQLGALTALQTLPFPILGMFVGVVADRVSRRRIMIIADIVRFLALASIPMAATGRAIGMPQLYGVALVSGAASAFFGIAYQSYLPVIVPAKRLTDANAKLETHAPGAWQGKNRALPPGIGRSFAVLSKPHTIRLVRPQPANPHFRERTGRPR